MNAPWWEDRRELRDLVDFLDERNVEPLTGVEIRRLLEKPKDFQRCWERMHVAREGERTAA